MNISSRRGRLFQRFPDPVIGYELSPEHGYFSVIIPEATTNLLPNPSVEVGTLFYAATGGAIAATNDWQAYGPTGLKITPIAVTECGAVHGLTLTAGTTYTFSVTIQGEEGKIYYVWFASNALALLGTKRKYIGTGHKQRIWVTYTETATLDRRVVVSRDAQYTDTHVFYADGFQVEAKSYPTTYCDGDQTGFVIGQTAYYWTGVHGQSTSVRSAQTRAGGREMSLLGFGFRVLAIMGLGMAPLVDQALPMPGRGELAQGTGTTAREFSLVGAMYADSSGPRHLQAQRDDLVDAFKPDLTTFEQPLILRYQACDEDGDPLGESLDIVCKYMGGLEGNWDNHQQERIVLNFKMHLPLIKNTYDSGIELGYQQAVADADFILMQNGANSTWMEMANGADQSVYTLLKGNDGYIYAGGAFNLMGGVADTVCIARWNGSWAAMGTGAQLGSVYALALGPDGSIYAGGQFNTMGGVANTARIAKWDGTVWTPLGTGMNGDVWALAFAPDGTLYAGGDFTTAGGVAAARVAKWDGVNWSALGAGVTGGVVFALTVAQDGTLYVGGAFTSAGGIALITGRIAKWIPSSGWNTLYYGGMDNTVRALAFGPDGILYIGGSFTDTVYGTAGPYLCIYDGNLIKEFPGPEPNGAVYNISFGKNNEMYIGGAFTQVGNVILPDRLAIWTGSNWLPFDVDLPTTTIVYDILYDPATDFTYLAFNNSGTAYSANVEVPTIGGSKAYSTIVFTGPGTLYQLKSYTTGKTIAFDITLVAGETATLNLDPANISFISTFRGNILNTILPGSNLNFELLPGTNNISAFMFGSTTAATKIVMSWREQYWSLDGAAWK